MSEVKLRAFVDRFEGDQAVLFVGDGPSQVLWPVADLPDGAAEGSVLEIALRLDSAATRAAEDATDSLIDRLERGE